MAKDDYSPSCLQVKLDDAGFYILACECENRHWLAVIRRDEKDGEAALRLFCGLCNSYSGPLVPADQRDQALLTEARKELESGEENDWATEVDSATKRGGGNLKN